MPFRLSTAARNASVNGVVDLVDLGTAGTLEIRSGAQPATPDTAASGTLLATFTLPDPAFGAAASGTATMLGVPLSTTGVAAGTAEYFRLLDGNGAAVADGSVGATGSGADMILNTTTISVGVTVELTSGTVTQPVG